MTADAPWFGPVTGAVPFRINGETYTLPSLPGRVVAGHAAAGNWPALIPDRLAGDGRERMYARLRDRDDPVDVLWLAYVAETVLERVCGLPWHVVCRLCAVAVHQWVVFDGWCLMNGVDPQRLPAHRVVAAVHAWIRSSCEDRKEWSQVEARLFAPPSRPILEARLRRLYGEEDRGGVPSSWGDEAAMFEQAMQTFGR